MPFDAPVTTATCPCSLFDMTELLLSHPCLGVLLRFTGVGVEFTIAIAAMFPERHDAEQKCRSGRRPNGVVDRGFHPERTSHRQRETEQQRRCRECPPMKPPPYQQSACHNHLCCCCQDGRRPNQGWRQEPQESGGVCGESAIVSPCHPGAKLTPQAEAIGNRREE